MASLITRPSSVISAFSSGVADVSFIKSNGESVSDEADAIESIDKMVS
jgi:hypothetical protein